MKIFLFLVGSIFGAMWVCGALSIINTFVNWACSSLFNFFVSLLVLTTLAFVLIIQEISQC